MGHDEVELMQEDIDFADRLSAKYVDRRHEVFAAVLSALLVKRILEGPGDRAPRRATLAKPTAPTEFFAKLRPAQDVDKVLGAAFFLEAFREKAEFGADELKACLVEGKIHPPSNISLAILRNAQKGLVSPKGKKGGKKLWFLTQTGTEAVQKLLQASEGEKK